jgi:hypothetical protein
MAAQPGYDIYGRPLRPNYVPTYDPKTQSIFPFAMERTSGINPDTRGIEQFRKEALRSGPSQYAMLANKMQGELTADARDRAAREGASGTAGAMNALAMRGGVTSGARERIAKSGAENVMSMNQNIAGQDAQNRIQIASNDEQNRMSRLGQLPAMEIAAVAPQFEKARMEIGARGQDIGREVGEKQTKNLFDMTTYQEGMKSWAAARQANATANSGKK